MAQPRPGRAARPAARSVRARPGARAALFRGPPVGRPARGPQRRRQPARALLDIGANEILQLLTTVVLVGAAFVVFIGDLALLAFLPVPVIVWGSIRFQHALEPRYALVRERAGELSATLSNNLQGIATIKAFAAERRESARIASGSQRYAQANRDAIRLSSAFVPLIRMAILAGFTAILVLGGLRALDGQLEVGVYSVLVFITQRLLWPLTRLGETFDLYQRGMASTRRILDLLEETPDVVAGTDVLPPPVRGEVTFEQVDFGYDDGAPVLSGLDLHVPTGQTHALVGATGAGKSTIVKLLLRLYDPDRGRVLLDGVDIRTLTFAGLRGVIGVVGQDVFLFHGTVGENLRFGRPGATDAQLLRSAALAEADGFVAALPRGYDTVIGERGQKLSGGQRQRLSIARAILTDPTVFVLDEATSAVDNETEAAIQRRSNGWPVTGPRSSSRTVCRPSATPTASMCSTTVASSRPAPMTRCSQPTGATRRCGGSRQARRRPRRAGSRAPAPR
ncbi:MAG TPA: ABC transporter ATP-binding protein [Euzebyales bacterium]|nr:ABC transporter ATP-binding protein [Euzebyales bacterium]